MACEFDVKLMGKKGHVHWELDPHHERQLLVYLQHEPLTHAANEQLITEIAEALGINKSKVRIVHGEEQWTKRIKITDHEIGYDEVLVALGVLDEIEVEEA